MFYLFLILLGLIEYLFNLIVLSFKLMIILTRSIFSELFFFNFQATLANEKKNFIFLLHTFVFFCYFCFDIRSYVQAKINTQSSKSFAVNCIKNY